MKTKKYVFMALWVATSVSLSRNQWVATHKANSAIPVIVIPSCLICTPCSVLLFQRFAGLFAGVFVPRGEFPQTLGTSSVHKTSENKIWWFCKNKAGAYGKGYPWTP
jgi:hypothetical protein